MKILDLWIPTNSDHALVVLNKVHPSRFIHTFLLQEHSHDRKVSAVLFCTFGSSGRQVIGMVKKIGK